MYRQTFAGGSHSSGPRADLALLSELSMALSEPS
jgi:hypothetical protein